MNPTPVLDELTRLRVVPVISESDSDAAMRLVDALVEAGLPVAEIALRADGALAALTAVARRGDCTVIAGTVISPDQVDRVADAGASMVVSPGLSPAVVERSLELGLPVCPGVATPTDVQTGLSLGVSTLKFFPAEAAGGVAMLNALSGPFPAVRLMPTGGVSAANLRDYLSVRAVFACGGSWMVSPGLYADGRFDRVTAAAREAVRLASDAP